MKNEAVVGAIWTLVDRFGGQALSFVSFVILARLLLPADYGIVALATAIIAIPLPLNGGFSTALVQRESLRDEHVNAAFWANIILSLCFVTIFMMGADWIAKLARVPSLAPILRALSVTLVPLGLASVAGAFFLRRIRYSAFALRTVVAQTTCAMVAIAFALLSFGVWALVAQQLSYAVVSMLVLWVGSHWRPRLAFSAAAFCDIFRFSASTMAGNFLRFAYEQVDVLIIGLFLSPTSVGLYYLAQRLLLTVNAVTFAPIDSVMMPVLSRLQSDHSRLRHAYLQMMWGGACLWVPAVAGLGTTAPRILDLLFGNKWQGATGLLMLMSTTAVTTCFTRPTREILLAVNCAEIYAVISSGQLVLTIAAFLIGVQYALVGCGAAYAIVSALVVPFHLYAVKQHTGITPREVVVPLLPIFGAGAFMAAATYGTGQVAGLDKLTVVVAQIAAGLLVYPVALYFLAPDQTRMAMASLSHLVPVRFRVGRGQPRT